MHKYTFIRSFLLCFFMITLLMVRSTEASAQGWERLYPDASHVDLPKAHSPLQVILDGESKDGVILVPDSVADPKELIRKQLRYTLGQMQWFNSIAQYSWFEIQLGSSRPLPNGMKEVRYQLRVHISWDRQQEIPDVLELVLPARGDQQGLHDFYDRYAAACNGKGEVDLEEFFYYFYPLQNGCPLSSQTPGEIGSAVRIHFTLNVSSTNTTDKYPEYQKMWEDGKLIVTLIYSKNEKDSNSNRDEGIYQYNATYAGLLSAYGEPDSINDHFTGAPGVRHPVLEMKFQTNKGPLLVSMRLVSTVEDAGQDFVDWYQQRTPDSDLVIYNGHSGLGANIDRLGSLGKFKTGQYQLYFLDGCGTYAYFGEQLFRNHGSVNPGYAPTKHLDVMTNTLSSYFNQETKTTLMMIQAMIRRQDSYAQILERIDPKQRVVVDGEQDN